MTTESERGGWREEGGEKEMGMEKRGRKRDEGRRGEREKGIQRKSFFTVVCYRGNLVWFIRRDLIHVFTFSSDKYTQT